MLIGASTIHQSISFQPLNITRECLRALTFHLDISAEFLEVMSSFYQKVTNTEETYCAPLVVQETTKLFGIHSVKPEPVLEFI